MVSLGRILNILFAASWATTAVLGRSNLYTGWTLKFNNVEYPTQTVQAGDSITFIWTVDEIQNVFIHPTNDCTQTGRVAIGNQSPTEYVFKEEDAGKSLFFACDIDERCENYGMRLIVNVLPLGSDNEPEPDVPSLTLEPTDSPTIVETRFTFSTLSPTIAPVAAPTNAPVIPTNAPVFPTDAPIVPTNPPTATPTSPPNPLPTFPPTPFPTFPPTPLPTFPPTPLPTTVQPTFFSTTWYPTDAPSKDGTLPPTESPSKGRTLPPTDSPSRGRTLPPTDVPSKDTGNDMKRVTMRGLQMTLTGIDSFSDQTQRAWATETQTFSTSHYVNEIEGGLFRTSIAVTNFVSSPQSRKLVREGEKLQRQLQLQEGVVITYNQVVSYSNAGDVELSEEYLAKSPFAFPEQRDNYVKALQSSNDPGLERVDVSSPVMFANEIVPTNAPITTKQPQPSEDPEPKSGLSMPAIIGIACGGGALLIIGILFCIYCKAQKPTGESDMEEPPPSKISIKEDEVSTLAGPSIAGNPAGFGDRSVGTVDYDYSKAYGNGEHSVSDAGGTFGSNTQNNLFPMNAGATGAALGPYGDDGSYENHFQNSTEAKVKEEILTIFAPPGKLGVVIDTPDDGAPVVHAVKETSVVFDKVQVGDKLVAVDDEDVRTLTAIKVSKLISRKSANPSRKLTILRITQVG